MPHSQVEIRLVDPVANPFSAFKNVLEEQAWQQVGPPEIRNSHPQTWREMLHLQCILSSPAYAPRLAGLHQDKRLVPHGISAGGVPRCRPACHPQHRLSLLPPASSRSASPESFTHLNSNALYWFGPPDETTKPSFSRSRGAVLSADDSPAPWPGGFAAAPDVAPPIFFNSGMMLITPSEERHADLLAKTRTLPSYDDGDQGYLNAYFGQKWHRLPYAYNFMKSKTGNPDAFYWILDNKWETIKVVHMVGVKPWRCTSKRDCGGFPERVIPRLWALWWDAFLVISPSLTRHLDEIFHDIFSTISSDALMLSGHLRSHPPLSNFSNPHTAHTPGLSYLHSSVHRICVKQKRTSWCATAQSTLLLAVCPRHQPAVKRWRGGWRDIIVTAHSHSVDHREGSHAPTPVDQRAVSVDQRTISVDQRAILVDQSAISCWRPTTHRAGAIDPTFAQGTTRLKECWLLCLHGSISLVAASSVWHYSKPYAQGCSWR